MYLFKPICIAALFAVFCVFFTNHLKSAEIHFEKKRVNTYTEQTIPDAFARTNDYIGRLHGNLYCNDYPYRWHYKYYFHPHVVRLSLETDASVGYDVLNFFPDQVGNKDQSEFLRNLIVQPSPDDSCILFRQLCGHSVIVDANRRKKVVNTLLDEYKALGYATTGELFCLKNNQFDTLFIVNPESGAIRKTLNISKEISDFLKDQPATSQDCEIIHPPQMSPDERYLVLSVAAAPLQYDSYTILVYEMATGRLLLRQNALLKYGRSSTSPIHSRRYVFSENSSRLLFQSDVKTVVCYDMEKQSEIGRFRDEGKYDEFTGMSSRDLAYYFFYDNSNKVIVQFCLPPRLAAMNPTAVLPLEAPYEMTYSWDLESGAISHPKPWVKEGAYTLKHWVSPDKKTLATYYINYDPEDWFRAFQTEKSRDTLALWDIESGELLDMLEGNISSVQFSESWNDVLVKFDSWDPKDRARVVDGIIPVTSTVIIYEVPGVNTQ